MSDAPDQQNSFYERLLLALGKAQADQGGDLTGRITRLEVDAQTVRADISAVQRDVTAHAEDASKKFAVLTKGVFALCVLAVAPTLQSLGIPTKELVPFALKIISGILGAF